MRPRASRVATPAVAVSETRGEPACGACQQRVAPRFVVERTVALDHVMRAVCPRRGSGHLPALRVEVLHPVVHEWPPRVEQVAPCIRRFGLVAYDVGERSLHHRPRVIRPLGRPVPERRPEAMRNGSDPQLLEQLREPRIGELLAARAGKDQPGGLGCSRASGQALCRMQDLYRAGAQRYPVLTSRLHPSRRDRPLRSAEVDLFPPRPPRFPRPDRRQHHELEAQLRAGPRRRGVPRINGAGNLPMRKRWHVPHVIRTLR